MEQIEKPQTLAAMLLNGPHLKGWEMSVLWARRREECDEKEGSRSELGMPWAAITKSYRVVRLGSLGRSGGAMTPDREALALPVSDVLRHPAKAKACAAELRAETIHHCARSTTPEQRRRHMQGARTCDASCIFLHSLVLPGRLCPWIISLLAPTGTQQAANFLHRHRPLSCGGADHLCFLSVTSYMT